MKKIFEKKAQFFEQENRRRHHEERRKILNRIQSAINKVVQIEGYDVVIDANSVVYAKKSKDITDIVFQQIE